MDTYYLLPAPMRDQLVQYLNSRPIGEAIQFFIGLQNLSKAPVDPQVPGAGNVALPSS